MHLPLKFLAGRLALHADIRVRYQALPLRNLVVEKPLLPVFLPLPTKYFPCHMTMPVKTSPNNGTRESIHTLPTSATA